MKLVVKHGGDIWYRENCTYLNKVTIPVGGFNDNCFYDLLYWLKTKYEVEFENAVWFGNEQTKRITYEDGKTVIITGDGLDETELVAVIDINYAEDFRFFDDIREFELFYDLIVIKTKELLNTINL